VIVHVEGVGTRIDFGAVVETIVVAVRVARVGEADSEAVVGAAAAPIPGRYQRLLPLLT